ncbi:MAG: hypothetical protein GY853_16590 [PVC group bacterium]|nr:hypothetical protein [PVC group bacterium]
MRIIKYDDGRHAIIINKHIITHGLYDADRFRHFLYETNFSVRGIDDKGYEFRNREILFTAHLYNKDSREGKIWNGSAYHIHVFKDGTCEIHTHYYLSIDTNKEITEVMV